MRRAPQNYSSLDRRLLRATAACAHARSTQPGISDPMRRRMTSQAYDALIEYVMEFDDISALLQHLNRASERQLTE